MSSIEIPLHNDPMDYEPKPIFGRLSYRGAASLAVLVIAEIPLAMAIWRSYQATNSLALPIQVYALLAAIPAIPVALIGISKRNGLHFEKWFPAMLREQRTPKELPWRLPQVILTQVQEDPEGTKEERRQAKRDQREAKRAAKPEGEEDARLAGLWLEQARAA